MKMMKAALGAGLLLCAATAWAKEKPIALSESDAAALRGKTAALTVHERPSFVAMTPGKASFALLGAAAMISAGNKIVDQNGVEDPAILVRKQLAQALANRYGVIVLDVDTIPSKANKPKDLAALHPEADYVFDVSSTGWQFSYFPTDWDNYWMAYNVQTRLVDTKTGRQLASMGCNAHTKEHAQPPSRDQLLDNNAQLLKDVTQHLGWTCTHILAKEQYGLLPEQVAGIPDQYVDPLTPRANVAAAPTAGEANAPAADTAAPVQVAEGITAPPAAAPTGAGTPTDAVVAPASSEGAGTP